MYMTFVIVFVTESVLCCPQFSWYQSYLFSECCLCSQWRLTEVNEANDVCTMVEIKRHGGEQRDLAFDLSSRFYKTSPSHYERFGISGMRLMEFQDFINYLQSTRVASLPSGRNHYNHSLSRRGR